MAEKRVWKFRIPILGAVQMPVGAQVLDVAFLNIKELYLWALVDPEAPVEKREFLPRPTGTPVPEGAQYIGTAAVITRVTDKRKIPTEWFAVHVFEMKKN